VGAAGAAGRAAAGLTRARPATQVRGRRHRS
jgi:hypothetical protein